MQSTYLLPAQQSALFQLLAQTPGFQIVRDAADILGRRGVGIYWPYQGSGAMIIFDPATYHFLGFGTWGQGDVPANGQVPPASGGAVAAPDGTALVAMAIVNSEPSVSPSDRQKLAALIDGAAMGRRAARASAGDDWYLVADYLRAVLHMSPAQVQQHMREFAQLVPSLACAMLRRICAPPDSEGRPRSRRARQLTPAARLREHRGDMVSAHPPAWSWPTVVRPAVSSLDRHGVGR